MFREVAILYPEATRFKVVDVTDLLQAALYTCVDYSMCGLARFLSFFSLASKTCSWFETWGILDVGYHGRLGCVSVETRLICVVHAGKGEFLPHSFQRETGAWLRGRL